MYRLLFAIRLLVVIGLCVVFEITFAQDTNSFDRKVTMNTPWFMDFADLNGDQIQDMVGVWGNSNAKIEIYHGKADGTFELKTTLTGSGEYYQIYLEKLNADDIPDILAMSAISGIIYLSSPTGYYPTSIIPASGPYFSDEALFADFDNDGDLDLFIENKILDNNGNAGFTQKDFIIGNGGPVATDFNNDGKLDLVKTNPGGGTIDFYPGNGDCTFGNGLSKSFTVQEAIAHDMNADGFVDIIAKGYNSDLIILYNDASFSFTQTSTIQLGHPFYSVLKIFDIDFDGKADLVTSNDNNIQYRPILPDGSLGAEKNINVGNGALRSLLFKDAIGEPFVDMIAMNGFGVTAFFSDKLNATIQFTSTEKIYDNLSFSNFYQVTPPISVVDVTYPPNNTLPYNVGSYEVNISIRDVNYEAEVLKGTVTIKKKTLTIDPVDVTISQGEAIPTFQLSYSGFAAGQNSLVLTQVPVATTTATADSETGEYEITVSGGVDENYEFDYKTGVLTIGNVTGIEEQITSLEVFPNPATDKIRINSPQWTSLNIYDVNGRSILKQDYTESDVSLEGCHTGLYILQLHFQNGNTFRQRLKVK